MIILFCICILLSLTEKVSPQGQGAVRGVTSWICLLSCYVADDSTQVLSLRDSRGRLMQEAPGREPLGANSCESNLAFTAQIAIQKCPLPATHTSLSRYENRIKSALKSQTNLKQNREEAPTCGIGRVSVVSIPLTTVDFKVFTNSLTA